MKCNFKVGQYVKCIAKPYFVKDFGGVVGEIYRVEAVGYSGSITIDGYSGNDPKRFRSLDYPNPPHKHAELIKAWADGAEIEYQSSLSRTWLSATTPAWNLDNAFRIKPTTHTITIDGKDIKISKESYNALKKSLT